MLLNVPRRFSKQGIRRLEYTLVSEYQVRVMQERPARGGKRKRYIVDRYNIKRVSERWPFEFPDALNFLGLL